MASTLPVDGVVKKPVGGDTQFDLDNDTDSGSYGDEYIAGEFATVVHIRDQGTFAGYVILIDRCCAARAGFG